MRLFLDSANLDEVREVASWGVLSGVTTNPTLAAREGVDIRRRVAEICDLVPGQVSASVVAARRDELVAMGRDLASISDNVVVQFAVDVESLAACRILSEAGVRVNMILVFSAAQAVLAANAGAAFCGPFIGRLDDIGADGVALLEEISQIYAVQGYPTELLAMSLRSPAHVIAAARAGADIAAIPYDVFLQMVSNPLTDLGSERFSADWSRPLAPGGGSVQGPSSSTFEPSPSPQGPPAMAPAVPSGPPSGYGYPAPGEPMTPFGAIAGPPQAGGPQQYDYDAGYGADMPPGN